MTVSEFRRRYSISAAAWRELADSGNLPRIYKDKSDRGRSKIADEDAQAWFDRNLRQWSTFGEEVSP